MHKSVISKLQEKFPNQFLFNEKTGSEHGDSFVGEDVSFFRKLQASGIDLYLDTAATVLHMKRFPLDYNYYRLYWSSEELTESKEG